MGDLGDQLRKAKLLSKKDSKRLAHEARVERSNADPEAAEQAKAAHEDALRAQRDATRQADRDREAGRQQAREQAAEHAAVLELLRVEARKASGGRMRFYFEDSEGFLPYVEAGPQEQRQLQEGGLWVVRQPGAGRHEYALLATKHVDRVRAVEPTSLVWGAP